MTIEAWYMDDSDEDQRLPHKTDPVQSVSVETLAALGVITWSEIEVFPVRMCYSFNLTSNFLIFRDPMMSVLRKSRRIVDTTTPT
jgi:hypothetical protein